MRFATARSVRRSTMFQAAAIDVLVALMLLRLKSVTALDREGEPCRTGGPTAGAVASLAAATIGNNDTRQRRATAGAGRHLGHGMVLPWISLRLAAGALIACTLSRPTSRAGVISS